jgi:tagatose-6-phosphate ketose/aldose isomerase
MLPVSATYPSGSLLADEIAQQPAVWPTTLEKLRSVRHGGEITSGPVIFTGAGSSAYAASAIVEAWPAARAVPTTDLLLQSVDEIKAIEPGIVDGGILISLARSGDSPESAAVVEKFQRHFPRVQHLALVCHANGRLAHLPGVRAICLDPRTNDRSLAMTGSFSNLVLGGLALIAAEQISEHLPTICQRVDQSLKQTNAILEQVARACEDRIVVLASGMQALAREAALKVIELTGGKVMAMFETFLGFRHGPGGFLRDNTPILCFLSSDPQKRLYEEDMIKNLMAKGLGHFTIVGDTSFIVARPHRSTPANAPELPDSLRTPFEIPFAQLLAYHLSVHAEVDPDNPSPDGTITRVVRPFRIHEEVAAC